LSGALGPAKRRAGAVGPHEDAASLTALYLGSEASLTGCTGPGSSRCGGAGAEFDVSLVEATLFAVRAVAYATRAAGAVSACLTVGSVSAITREVGIIDGLMDIRGQVLLDQVDSVSAERARTSVRTAGAVSPVSAGRCVEARANEREIGIDREQPE
jgi:hypothetical protein